MLELDEKTFDEQVLKADRPVVVDFFADWCRPCEMLGQVLGKVARDYGEKVVFAKVDIDVNQALTAQYNVTSLPTVLVFKQGKIVGRIVGLVQEQKIKTEIDNAMF